MDDDTGESPNRSLNFDEESEDKVSGADNMTTEINQANEGSGRAHDSGSPTKNKRFDAFRQDSNRFSRNQRSSLGEDEETVLQNNVTVGGMGTPTHTIQVKLL